MACTNTTKYGDSLNKWKGLSSADLIQALGSPARKITKEGGYTDYLYRKVRVLKKPDSINPSHVAVINQAGKSSVITTPASVIPGETLLLQCTTTFTMDQHHIIVEATAEGNDC